MTNPIDETRPTPENSSDAPARESVERAAENLFALKSARRQGAIRTLFSSAGTFGLLLFATIVAIETFGMTPITRRALNMLQTKDGVKLDFEAVEGGLVRGDLILRNVSIKRKHPTQPNFDLTCSRVRFRCSPWSMFATDPKIEELTLSELVGEFEIPKLDRIEIGQLRIVDSQLNVSDRTIDGKLVTFELNLKSLNCKHFRTDLAPFDILFRSQCEGTLEGVPFQIVSTQLPDGERTEWHAKKLPIKFAQAYLGGPFTWLSAGTIDVRTVQLIKFDPTRSVQLDCQMVFNDVRAGVPDGLKPAVAIAAQFLVSYLNEQSRPLTLNFTVELDRTRFDLRTTESLSQLWSQIRAAAILSLLNASGQKLDFVVEFVGAENSDEVVEKVIDMAAKALERIRQRREAKRNAKRPVKEMR